MFTDQGSRVFVGISFSVGLGLTCLVLGADFFLKMCLLLDVPAICFEV